MSEQEIELTVLQWLRTSSELTGADICTKLRDQTGSDPWPEEVVLIKRVPFASELEVSYQDRDMYLDRAMIAFTCYSSSQPKAADLWKRVRKRVRHQSLIRPRVSPATWVVDEEAPETHIDTYVGTIVIPSLQGREIQL